MLKNIGDLVGRTLEAEDGTIGEIRGFFFEDKHWAIRYFVVETSEWIDSRTVLISHASLKQPDWNARSFPVALTREQIRKSPGIDCYAPVSRQTEAQIAQYFGWPRYWGWDSGRIYQREMASAEAGPATATAVREGCEPDNPRVRSTQEVFGYTVQAIDGPAGDLTDFIVDDRFWEIQYLAVSVGNWLEGKHVLVSPGWVEGVDWAESEIRVGLFRRDLGTAPEYFPGRQVAPEDEARLVQHYGRPRWDRYAD